MLIVFLIVKNPKRLSYSAAELTGVINTPFYFHIIFIKYFK